ncbi:MAG: spermidine synthase, partial [Moraxellaceae bacterium]
QLLMGLFALATVVIYNQMFGLMQGMVQTLAKTETGYLLFNMGSHLIAMLVMLPATFLAGMTLPLVTYSLLRHGAGESAIGKVYAFNTLGAILGVWLTVQFLMPMFGLKAAIMVGAGLDLVLGIYLLAVARTAMRWQRAAILASVVVLVAVGVGTQFDHTRMASGVFRHGKLFDTITPVYRQDGRTATVDVFDIDRGLRLISTNGKPDASVSMDATQPRSPDEPTMVLTGALPLLAKPEARTAAVIGMGSGISANVMLASPRLAHLDVIEIESAMVEGARHFGRFSSRVYNDPRSHIHIDDAKSYFAVHKRRYDLIVSEPSNPWVSGVANLFTDEFYARITHHLNDDGLLVQWFQLYETDPAIISSILKALGRHFEDYRIYAANGSDAIVVASKRGPVPALQAAGFEMLRKELGDVAMLTLDDVRLHEIGNRRLLEPMFALRPAPVNSDFFPFVDQHAVKARFLKHNFLALMELRTSGLPLPGIARDGNLLTNEEKEAVSFTPRLESLFAQRLRRHLLEGAPLGETAPVVEGALITVRPLRDCNNLVQQDLWQQQFILLASITVPHLSAEAHAPLSRYYAEQLCAGEGSASSRALVEMVGALAARDAVATEAAARRWLAIGLPVGDSVRRYVMQALVWSLLEQEKPEAAWALRAGFKGTPSAALELMWLHAQLATPQWRQ